MVIIKNCEQIVSEKFKYFRNRLYQCLLNSSQIKSESLEYSSPDSNIKTKYFQQGRFVAPIVIGEQEMGNGVADLCFKDLLEPDPCERIAVEHVENKRVSGLG